MNSAARLLSKGNLSRSWVVSIILPKIQFMVVLLITAVLISALSLIYVTNVSRSLHASIQQTRIERNHLHVQWGQLLLERGTWITTARVQHIAEGHLGMMVPENKSVVIVNE